MSGVPLTVMAGKKAAHLPTAAGYAQPKADALVGRVAH